MNKEEILSEIRRTTFENKGEPLGRVRFEKETGIKESDWLGKIWTRWNDAIVEAGFHPNQMNQPHAVEDLLAAIMKLIRELGHFPTQPEMNLRRRNDSEFPSPDSIRRRLGRKSDIAGMVIEYCNSKEELQDVIDICVPLAKQRGPVDSDDGLQKGHVYLLKHGREYKIGRSIDAVRRYKEIRLQMPLDTEEVHVIETDDAVGIEAYWHNRFKEKRLKGEWFRLTPKDISAFRRRKFM